MRSTKFKNYDDLPLTLTAPEELPLDIFDDLPVSGSPCQGSWQPNRLAEG